MAIVRLNSSHIEEIAKLHIQGIKAGFISSLGLNFVKELYKSIAQSESCFGFIEEENNVAVGYIAFTTNLSDLYKRIILKRLHRFIPLLLSKTFSIRTVKNIFETLFYYKKVKLLNLPNSELLSIVVCETHKGRGIAKRLIQEGIMECKKRNIKEIKVLVDKTNETANTLYRNNGFQAAYKISSHGVLSNIYLAFIDKKEQGGSDHNTYAETLSRQGKRTLSLEGIDWFEYNYFLLPAYLPHCLPKITAANAENALRTTKAFFARWETSFAKTEDEGQWWHVIRKGPWSLQECSSNTRSKIRRGRKKIHAEIVTPDLIESKGYELCKKACKRYNSNQFLPKVNTFQKKIFCARVHPDNFHFFGAFFGDELIAFSENYIQENAVLWESIWYDPEYLRYYSSYVLIDKMLDYYLNEQEMVYVSDGSRSIYHRTNVQEFLMDKFGFKKEFAVLHLVYSPKFSYSIRAINLLAIILSPIKKFLNSNLLYGLEALLLQEKIRNSYSNGGCPR